MQIIFKAALLFVLCSCSSLKKNVRSKNSINDNRNLSLVTDKSQINPDTSKRNNNIPKKYNDVITQKAFTDVGLFSIHQLDNKYFFEIPDSILGRDILVVARVSKSASGSRPYDGILGYAGDEINKSLIQIYKGPKHKIFVKAISFNDRAVDSSENGLYQSVLNSNLQPILAAFDIKAYTPDSSAIVVDFTDFMNNDNGIFFFNPPVKKIYNLSNLHQDKSYISTVLSYPINIELNTVKTYTRGEEMATFEINTSIVLLPKEPMQPRHYDNRIGYFYSGFTDFDAPYGVRKGAFINRWKLEPRDDDKERYLKGELVEPKKPIVYYIDPATPKKWIPYLMQGVNDWQKAFEKAGFKNAIYALEAPKNDSEWSLYDARHNAIIYMPSIVPNAMGPNIHDPRSGEILESHIQWYHNVMQLLRDWYFIQASPNDPRAQRMQFDDSLMGQLIRFVSSHEVGHTLGLMHNFGASSTIPVEKLRDKKWVEENGHTPSIMDYARFNYVAQPEDSISPTGLYPRIGLYDEWAIEWGYRWFPPFKTIEEERTFLNKWIIAKLKSDNRHYYGQQNLIVTDPRNQSEDLGDNAMKAGYYGIENLKKVYKNLINWTHETNNSYDGLKAMKDNLLGQFQRYIMHVANNIGLYMWTKRSVEEKLNSIDFVPKEKQKEAVQFLHKQIFETPKWLLDNEIFVRVGGLGYNLPYAIQNPLLKMLISHDTYFRMSYFETTYPTEAYNFKELLADLESGIWSELKTGSEIEFCRRNLQRAYAERLVEICNPGLSEDPQLAKYSLLHFRTEMFLIVKKQILGLIEKIKKAITSKKNEKDRDHLLVIMTRLQNALESKAPITSPQKDNTILNNLNSLGIDPEQHFPAMHISKDQGCWYKMPAFKQ